MVPDDTSTGDPILFVLDDGAWRIWPTPNGNGTLIESYWRSPASLNTGDSAASDLPGQTGEVDWLLFQGAVAMLLRKDENPTWQVYWATYQQARDEYKRERFRATGQNWDIQPSRVQAPPNTLAWLSERGLRT